MVQSSGSAKEVSLGSLNVVVIYILYSRKQFCIDENCLFQKGIYENKNIFFHLAGSLHNASPLFISVVDIVVFGASEVVGP